jgi:hypothetical protein
MAQIQKGTTYSTGDQVTATNLNALADAAILLPGAITDQTAKTVPLAADTILLHSAADTALRKSTLTQLFANATGIPISTGVSGLGTGIATALAVNTGSAGAPVLFNGALGTPASGTVTNLTGTASININGTVGATTANTGAFTTLSATQDITASGGNILNTSGGTIPIRVSGATTGSSVARFANTGGDTFFGAEGNATNNLIVGCTAYDTIVRGPSGIAFSANAGSNMQMRLSSTGLAVTGALSSTTGANFATSSGSVGIGTATAVAKLDVRTSASGEVTVGTFSNDSAAAGTNLVTLAFASSGVTKASISSAVYGNGYMAFRTNDNTEKMRIDASGNVGIGTTSPSQKLTVIGDVAFRGSSSNSDASNIPINLLFSKSSGNSATANLSVTTDFTFTGATGWRNCVLTTTASHINLYGGLQGAVEELIQFRVLNSSPGVGQINVIRTNTNGSTITLTYSAPSNNVLRVVATFNDTQIPGTVPTHELWVSFSMLSSVAVTVS